MEGAAAAKPFYENRWLGDPSWISSTGQVGVRGYARQQGYVLLSIDPATGKETTLAGTDPRTPYDSPRWSLDGKSMLVIRRSDMRPDGSYTYDLLVGPSNDLSQLKAIFSTQEYIRTPRFSPDGRVILFNLPLRENSQRCPTWAIPADGSREPCLVDHRADSTNSPELSPDGQYLLAARDYGLHRLKLGGTDNGR